jgi:PAS domain S-box-containing protein
MGNSPIRVLLIEDRETDYLLTRRMLSSVEGQPYDLQWADSWPAGIDAIRRCAHDVCLLDFRIGGGDGLELLKESRDIGCRAPVILLTGVNDYRLDIAAMESGAADFLVKDIITPALLERSIRYSLAQAKALEELQRRQDDLRGSELRFRSVVQSAADAIILADDGANIVFWNKGAETIFGYPEDDVVGSSLEMLIPERYRDFLRNGIERFRITGRSQTIGRRIELEGIRKDGTIFPLELSVGSWADGGGTMFTAFIRDITERRRAEELRNEKETAEEANRSKSRFVSRMSQELRTPLQSIIGFTNLLRLNKTRNLTEHDIDFLERILLNAKDQLALINSVVDLSQVEAGGMDLQIKTVSVDAIVRDVVKQFEGERPNPNVEIVLRLPSQLKAVQADPQKLKQVLVNLVDNALKFTERGSVTIEVTASPVDSRAVRIDVIDTGVGMPSDRISEIFEPFRRLNADAKGEPRGTGLGLSLCKSLCDLMGYQLQVSSERGRGSTFGVVLSAVEHLPLTA